MRCDGWLPGSAPETYPSISGLSAGAGLPPTVIRLWLFADRMGRIGQGEAAHESGVGWLPRPLSLQNEIHDDPAVIASHAIDAPSRHHCTCRAGCDIERCYHCGWQALGCLHFDPNDPRRQAWNGKWPGEDDCERLDFLVNGDVDFPDLNRLFTDCVWDADTGHVGSGNSERARPAGCLSQSNIDGVPAAQPHIAPVDLGFQLTLVFNAGRRSVNLDHPVGTMATNANLALAEVRTQDFLDAAIALRSHSYFA